MNKARLSKTIDVSEYLDTKHFQETCYNNQVKENTDRLSAVFHLTSNMLFKSSRCTYNIYFKNNFSFNDKERK